MDVAAVDRSAVSGSTPLHRAAPTTKLLASAILLAAVITTDDPFLTAAIAFSLTGAAAALRLPLKDMLPLALYPALFAVIFALAAAAGPVTGALVVLRAVTAALVAVTLMFTTPYPQVFAPIQRITPSVVGDALLMTYRCLFILGEKLGNLVRAVRLRAGLSGRQPLRAAKATAQALGGLVLYSLDLAQRQYDVLYLRGYQGRFRARKRESADRKADVATLGYATLVIAVVLAFRWLHGLHGYSWIATAAAMVGMAAGLTGGRRRS